MDAFARPMPRMLLPGVVLIVLAALLGLWTLLHGDAPFAVDVGWNAALTGWRVPLLEGLSFALSVLGGVWVSIVVFTIGGSVALLIARRPWAALFLVTAQAVSAGLVQAGKHLFGRARPEEILVLSDYGSFPSGHAANAATVAAVAVVLFPRVWVIVAGAVWVVLMAFSRTYLHAHWASDTLGGVLLGTGAVLVVAALYAPRLRAERAPVTG